MELSTHESRVIGALLGVHAGDSLGATFEFQNRAKIAAKYPNGLRQIVGGGPFSWPAGHATDDTDMTRGVLLAYRDLTPEADVARLAGDYFVKWLRGNWPGRKPGSRPKDIGGATRQGLSTYIRTRDPNKSGAGQGRSGNGSLMRCIPTGLFQNDPEKVIDESIRISKITHDDINCTISCAVYNTIVSQLVQGKSTVDAVTAGESVAARLEKTQGQVSRVVKWASELNVATMAQHGPPVEMKGRTGGFVLDSLAIAIAALLDSRSLEDILVDVVRIGNDTDTNTAIAGGLLGARDGKDAIPKEWREKLQFAQEFEELALTILRREEEVVG